MLKEHFIECRDYIFNFLEEPMIPSDNNASERGIRKLKIKQKISGTFRADKGADAFFAYTLLPILRGKINNRNCKPLVPSFHYKGLKKESMRDC